MRTKSSLSVLLRPSVRYRFRYSISFRYRYRFRYFSLLIVSCSRGFVTDGAARAEPNLFELCRVVTEEDN